jgi:hypothetical protein
MVTPVQFIRGVDNVSWVIEVNSENSITIDRTGIASYLRGNEMNDFPLVERTASDVIQMLWDAPARQLLTSLPPPEVRLLADLPDGHPDKTTDPDDFPLEYWADSNGDPTAGTANTSDRLISDDPDKHVDPAKPTQFWSRIVPEDEIGRGGNTVDVHRAIAAIDPATGQPYGGVATHLQGRSILFEAIYAGTIESADLRQFSPPTVLR